MPSYDFETPDHVRLHVEIGKGLVLLDTRSADPGRTHVEVTGHRAEEVTVEQDGSDVAVVAPRALGSSTAGELHVEVHLPAGADLSARLGSADLRAHGRYGTARLRSGTGDVQVDELGGETQVETGSGDVEIDTVGGVLTVKCGSGDVEIGAAADAVAVSTGSGDVALDVCAGPVQVKTGSGDLHIGSTGGDLVMSTGSGDVVIDRTAPGRVSIKGASTDVRLGIPDGLPVWTDIRTVSGQVKSDLAGTGQPAEGQPYLELRVVTVSGDVRLCEA